MNERDRVVPGAGGRPIGDDVHAHGRTILVRLQDKAVALFCRPTAAPPDSTRFVARLDPQELEVLLRVLRQGQTLIEDRATSAVAHRDVGPAQVVRLGPPSWHQLGRLAGDGCPTRAP